MLRIIKYCLFVYLLLAITGNVYCQDIDETWIEIFRRQINENNPHFQLTDQNRETVKESLYRHPAYIIEHEFGAILKMEVKDKTFTIFEYYALPITTLINKCDLDFMNNNITPIRPYSKKERAEEMVHSLSFQTGPPFFPIKNTILFFLKDGYDVELIFLTDNYDVNAKEIEALKVVLYPDGKISDYEILKYNISILNSKKW